MLHSTHCSPKNLSPINKGKKPKNTLRKILKGNGFFFLLAIAALLLYLRFDLFYIKTGSMEPALPVGTVVIVDTDANAVIRAQEGDIFAYQSGKNVVIHRIVSIDEEGYTFKGDANPSADAAKIARSQLIGKVIAKLKILVPVIRCFESR